jgi:hypothetical protein
MSDERQEIKVVGVDKAAIEMSSGKESLWGIPFKLSSKPNQDWERKFYEVQKSDANVMKRRMEFKDDCIKVDVSEMDDLQKILDLVRVAVTKANVLYEGDYQKKMKIRQDLEELQHKQGDVTKKLRDDSDKLQF